MRPSTLARGPPSTSGPGRHPFKVVARVRIPLGASRPASDRRRRSTMPARRRSDRPYRVMPRSPLRPYGRGKPNEGGWHVAKPFRGVINVDIRDSVPDWEPYTQPTAPDGAPNVLYVVLDDVGFSAMEPF